MFGWKPLARTLNAALRDVHSTKAAIRRDAVRELVPYACEKNTAAIKALQASLEDADPMVRVAAATGLADAESQESVQTLIERLPDESVQVQQALLLAIGEMGDSDSASAIVPWLTHDSATIRFQAIIAYVRTEICEENIVDALLSALRDKDPVVTHIAIRMAEEWGYCRGGEICLLPDDVKSEIEKRLQHVSDYVRIAAAILLANTGSSEGNEILTDVAIGNITAIDDEDTSAAIELVGKLKLNRATNGLEARAFPKLFRKDRFSWHALVALAHMKHARALDRISSDLTRGNWTQRTLAVTAAGKARLISMKETVSALRNQPHIVDPNAVAAALELLEESPS